MLNRIPDEDADEVLLYDDLFSALAMNVWRRPDLSKEIQHWIEERIRYLPAFYEMKNREKVVLQAAADIFFCKILVNNKHVFRPR